MMVLVYINEIHIILLTYRSNTLNINYIYVKHDENMTQSKWNCWILQFSHIVITKYLNISYFNNVVYEGKT